MHIIKDALLGKLGLPFTFWGLGILGSGVVTALTYLAIAYSAQFVDRPNLYNLITYGSSGFAIAWSLAVCSAIINASTHNRERDVWSGIATVLAVLGIMKALYSTAIVTGLAPMSFKDVERTIAIENLGLPVKLENDLTLKKMLTDRSERSLTYVYGIDVAALDKEGFDAESAKRATLEGCSDLKPWLSGPVTKIIMKWQANDGTSVQVEITPSDCGF